jgi:hypothetical protein
VSEPLRTARRICLGPVRTNVCAPSLLYSLSFSSRLEADQAIKRLLDSLELNASGNTPDSALSDGDTLNDTMRSNPVEFSGDSEEEWEGAGLAEEERPSKEASPSKKGVVDAERETTNVELYNKAKEELMLARKTVEDNATEIENLKLQLEHMKGFLTNLTVIG